MTSPSQSNESANGGAAPRPSLLNDRANAEDDARTPFRRDALHEDLRQALWATAHHIAVAGPDVRVANAFLGVAAFASYDAIDLVDPDRPDFPLERFPIAAILDRAYDFAFQVGPRAHRHHDALSDLDFGRLGVFRLASPRAFGVEGRDTPMDNDDSPICRTIDTANARRNLGAWMSVRDLALLAHMTEPAVRNGLSKERIKLKSLRKDDKNGHVDGDEALRWLQARRGFVPTLEPEPTDSFYVDDFRRLLIAQGFGAALSSMTFRKSLAEVAHAAEVDPEWLLEVVTGREAQIDVGALTRVARVTGADAPAFVARCVEMTLRALEPPPPRPSPEDMEFLRAFEEAASRALNLEWHETDPDVDPKED